MKKYSIFLGFFMGIMVLVSACREDLRDIDRPVDNSQGLDLNFSFVNKPEPGTELIVHLYYAEEENEPFYEKAPAKVLKHNLTAQDIEEGVTLNFEEPIPAPFAYVIAFADVDANGEISDGDIAICYMGQSVREVMSGVATAEDVSFRKFLTMKMDQVYSSERPPLDINLTFPSPPLPGVALELALYYAETGDVSLIDREPDVIEQHILTEADIADGLTLTFEELEDVPYLFARVYVDIDGDGELSYGDIAMFYGEKAINDVLQGRASPENIGPRSNIDISMSLWHADENGPLVDIDGKVYSTVIIGDLEWMAENLKVTRYRNGAPIATDLSGTDWAATMSGAYAIYPYELTADTPFPISSEEEMISRFGFLYNGYAVMDPQGLAPAGWRVATDEDYKALERFAGMSQEDVDKTGARGSIGAKLRSTSWNSGTDDFGFAALPAGFRRGSGVAEFIRFGEASNSNHFWTSTPSGTGNTLFRRNINATSINRNPIAIATGFSVRCVRDRIDQ
jgi:uncharacterized protein (TIGR02145 family)